MITVYSVYWGDKYSKEYVHILKRMVEANLTVPHRFVCVTDQEFEGIETIKPVCNYHGWWQKLSLFEIATGPSLYFDLDVVITGSIDYLVGFAKHKFSAAKNWGQSGHGGVQSSVMAWDGTWKDPFTKFNYEVDSKRLWGDQEFITELNPEYEPLPGIKSYKYHCVNVLPDDARVVCFHGKPDPHEVGDAWVKQFRFT